uniref:Uncharacterized protein n=1 Tax=Lepeophtheirus salmonis TaxID=72036 RepID=A0A0K2UTR8_LEPSM
MFLTPTYNIVLLLWRSRPYSSLFTRGEGDACSNWLGAWRNMQQLLILSQSELRTTKSYLPCR